MNVPDITSTNAMNLAEKRSAADLRRRQAAQKLSFGLFWLGALVVILIMLVVVVKSLAQVSRVSTCSFSRTPPRRRHSAKAAIPPHLSQPSFGRLILAISAPLGIARRFF
jgi:hypothetical protein